MVCVEYKRSSLPSTEKNIKYHWQKGFASKKLKSDFLIPTEKEILDQKKFR